MQNHQEILDILKGSVLTRGMTEEETRALLASSRVRLRTLAKGEIVFHEGDTPRGLYLLIEGALVIKKDTEGYLFGAADLPLGDRGAGRDVRRGLRGAGASL